MCTVTVFPDHLEYIYKIWYLGIKEIVALMVSFRYSKARNENKCQVWLNIVWNVVTLPVSAWPLGGMGGMNFFWLQKGSMPEKVWEPRLDYSIMRQKAFRWDNTLALCLYFPWLSWSNPLSAVRMANIATVWVCMSLCFWHFADRRITRQAANYH